VKIDQRIRVNKGRASIKVIKKYVTWHKNSGRPQENLVPVLQNLNRGIKQYLDLCMKYSERQSGKYKCNISVTCSYKESNKKYTNVLGNLLLNLLVSVCNSYGC
jgi:cell division FtsZ-interacting protein ZapD